MTLPAGETGPGAREWCGMGSRRGLCAALLCLYLALAGCGGRSELSNEELLLGMKEFSMPDGSASLYLARDWLSQDTGRDYLLAVGSEDGGEAVFVFRFPKDGIAPVESLADLRELVNDSCHVSGEEAIEAFWVPGMTNVATSRCTVTANGIDGQACLVYGETDYAFYAIGYLSGKWKDSMTASLRASCSSFSETPPG